MNKFTVLAITILAGGPIVHPPVAKAFTPSRTQCTSEGVADAGYVLNVAADLKSATLDEESIAGPREVAQMTCQLLPVKEIPDAINNYLLCRQQGAIDGGLIVRLYNGGIAGLHYASVRSFAVIHGKSVENEVQFGRLNCR